MNYYLAPMDNITDYIYRQIVWRHFPYWDKMYAPFIQPNEKPVIVPKKDRDICPANNHGIPAVPQILTCDANGFVRVGRILESYGYDEINLNLGCPARPIVGKGKGSAMLADTEKLDSFFDTVFKTDWNSKITVKTRLGLSVDSDFEAILKVFAKYPIEELTIHPRFREDYYNGEPRLDKFEKVFSLFNVPVSDEAVATKNYNTLGAHKHKLPFKLCFNGNIFSVSDALKIKDKYPLIDSIMIGRGAIADPSIIRQLKGGEPITLDEFKAFHDDILSSYKAVLPRERVLLHKMMEMWTYWIRVIPCEDEVFKSLRMSRSIEEYLKAINAIFT